ncbi:3-hexulose-6-phosphate synthase [Alteribacter populi]|uniref:3-hexulose-6-phosphate synthase n=1 Tax=Alteribacter populi TaxID=2011011 RepID=UPI000BBB5AC8|nr:3-hexulose-6-phosphate synthase [Alteribacter populi]
MKLQLALDRLSKKECYFILEQTSDFIDWIEIGTGVIKEYGVSIIGEVKEHYPNHTIVADMKTCDAGKHEAKQAFEADADITTAMAFSSSGTLTEMLDVAEQYEKRVMIDLLGVSEIKRVKEIEGLGADLVSLHIGKDMQAEGISFTDDQFQMVKGLPSTQVAVAGGVDERSLPVIAKQSPDVVIVGSAITKARNPKIVAERLKGMMTL